MFDKIHCQHEALQDGVGELALSCRHEVNKQTIRSADLEQPLDALPLRNMRLTN